MASLEIKAGEIGGEELQVQTLFPKFLVFIATTAVT